MDPSPRPPLIDYATPLAASRQSRYAVVLGTIAGVLGIGAPVTSQVIISFHLWSSYDANVEIAAALWGGGDVVALILGGTGWALARPSRPNEGYHLCSIINTLNWIGLAAVWARFCHM